MKEAVRRQSEGLEYWRKRLANAVSYRAVEVVRLFLVRGERLQLVAPAPHRIDKSSLDTFIDRLERVSVSSRAGMVALFENPALDHARLVRALGRTSRIPEDLACQALRALPAVVARAPKASGLFNAVPKYRGKGSKSWLTDMETNYYANGPAYEIVGTAALMQGHGVNLKIGVDDRVEGFGVKLKPGYRSLSSEHSMRGPERDTVEADLVFNRSGDTVVGVDFKHTTTGHVGVRNEGKFKDNLDGVVNAIKDGQLNEFHFVSNAAFSLTFVRLVDEANDALRAVHETPIGLHSYVNLS